jgi:SAM-dependent methyltransferase
MKLTANAVEQAYVNALEAYNKSPLALEHGWRDSPHDLTRVEIVECMNALTNEDAVLLDLGTGKAIVPRVVTSFGRRCISLDAPFSGPEARANAELAGIETQICDFSTDRFPLEDGQVDCVFFGDVIEHLPHSPRLVLNEIYRVLKPGGVCVCATPNSVRLPVRLKILLGYSNWPWIGSYYHDDFHVGHHHEYTADELRSVFEWAGFREIRMQLVATAWQDPAACRPEVAVAGYRKRNAAERGLRDIGRMFCKGAERFIPPLRSSMVAVAMK